VLQKTDDSHGCDLLNRLDPQCPVDLMTNSLQACNGKGFKGFMGVHDLNFILRTRRAPRIQSPGEMTMNAGQTLFAQVVGFVRWKHFGRIALHHRGDAKVRTLSCIRLFCVMAFAQLTWRETLRDIEACLTANQSKLFHNGVCTRPL